MGTDLPHQRSLVCISTCMLIDNICATSYLVPNQRLRIQHAGERILDASLRSHTLMLQLTLDLPRSARRR